MLLLPRTRLNSAPSLKSTLARISIYGDFWLRYLYWGARHCPWFLEPVIIFAFSGMFWVVLGPQRRAVTRNLGVILPGSSPLVNRLRAIRVFWNFAWSLADMAHVRLGDDCITWEVQGRKHLADLEKNERGAILLTAHMGNYDVAAPLFAKRIHRPIHMVRSPDRHTESQEYEKKKREQQVTDNFVIHYNEPGNMLGVTLVQAVISGGIVAIQGDRVLLDVSPMTVPFRGNVEWRVPRGPFALALVAKAPIHPVFVIRMGWHRYRIQAEPAIQLETQCRDRERVLGDAANRWTAVLRNIGQRHWRQWFAFEELFEGARATDGNGAREEQGGDDERLEEVIPAKPGRGMKAVMFWNLMAGGWTSAVVLRRLLEWAVGDWLHVVAALVAWPVIWFVAIVTLTQLSLGVAVVFRKVLRLGEKSCDALTCGMTVLAFGGIAWSEWRSGCPVGCWLGIAGLAAICVGVIYEIISQTRRE
jgi:lauroyl/myristoyl acyltransferase